MNIILKFKFIFCLLMLSLCVTNIFASNIGRTVYGVLSETYSGVSIDNSSAGEDYALMYGSGYDSTERIEGAVSTAVGWEGWFGVCFNTPQNMTAYNGGRIYFSCKAPTTLDTTNGGNVFKVSDNKDRIISFNSEEVKRVDVADSSNILGTGILADNKWHTYYIPVSSFVGLNLKRVKYLFISSSILKDNSVLIDNVYWTKAPSAARSFDVTVKNISDNQETTEITWNQSCYRQSWISADQYIELNLDQESNDWYIKIYVDNGKVSRKGLYCVDSDGSEIVLPMAWRIRPDLLPNAEGDTLQIAQLQYGSWGLYDVGKNPEGTDWYTWSFMREKNESLNEDMKVWDLRGIHTVVWDHNSWDTLRYYYEKNPKIYFAADCSKAIGGLTYTAKVVTELVFE